MRIAAVIVAGGRGTRAGGEVAKQYRMLGGEAVLSWTLRVFVETPAITAVVCVIGAQDRPLYDAALVALPAEKLLPPALGGGTRQKSVRAGLEALEATSPDIVLIHDAARPFVTEVLITGVIAAAAAHGAAVPGIAPTDTILEVSGDRIVQDHARDRLRRVQTPQAFRYPMILSAHRQAAAGGRSDFTDDASLARAIGLDVRIVAGDERNFKLTTPADFLLAEQVLSGGRAMRMRVGNGYDVHAFGRGDHVWLGGVRITHDHGLIGHSDADVGLHALTDAIFGAIALGDIGSHFPPSDPQWKGASSDRFLAFAAGEVARRGGVIDHLDLTLVCEMPKIGPYREAMRARIAEIAGLSPDQVGVKATTSERLGFTGRGEGIAALATATVRAP